LTKILKLIKGSKAESRGKKFKNKKQECWWKNPGPTLHKTWGREILEKGLKNSLEVNDKEVEVAAQTSASQDSASESFKQKDTQGRGIKFSKNLTKQAICRGLQESFEDGSWKVDHRSIR